MSSYEPTSEELSSFLLTLEIRNFCETHYSLYERVRIKILVFREAKGGVEMEDFEKNPFPYVSVRKNTRHGLDVLEIDVASYSNLSDNQGLKEGLVEIIEKFARENDDEDDEDV